MRLSADSSLAIGRHPRITRVLHWTTALILILSVTAILYRESTEQKAVRVVLMELHRQLGLLVLLTLLARITVRLVVGLRNHAPDLHKGVRLAATLAHWMMYVAIAGVILLGWGLSSAHAIHLRLFGLIPLPDLVTADSDLADTLADYHVWAAWLLLALVVPHVLAALWHHYIRRDGVLIAMLPQASVIRAKPVGLLQTGSTVGATAVGAPHPVIAVEHAVSSAARRATPLPPARPATATRPAMSLIDRTLRKARTRRSRGVGKELRP
jgi:cytochrome b561